MLIDLYLKTLGPTKSECSEFAHVWALLSAVGTLIERRVKLPFGDGHVIPNQYVVLIGEPGSRKSTAIKRITSLMMEAGYSSFAADKATMQSLLRDMAGLDENGQPIGADDLAGVSLDGFSFGTSEYTPVALFHDELSDFLGSNNLDYIRILGSLWDIAKPYDYRVKNAAPIKIPTPVINMLGASTPSQYHTMFPPEIDGQGFLSRLIRVSVPETGRRIPVPPSMDADLRHQIVSAMRRIQTLSGEVTVSKEADDFRCAQYIAWKGVRDKRFQTYETRRYQHFLKLAIIKAACSFRLRLEEEDMRWANAFLSYTEFHMGDAIGFYGKHESSEIAASLLTTLGRADRPLTVPELYKTVAHHVKSISDVVQLLWNLQAADLATTAVINPGARNETTGFVLKKAPLLETADAFVDYSLLRGIIPDEEIIC